MTTQPPVRPPQVSSQLPASPDATPFSPQKLRAWGTLMLELIIAQVAMALGNISVLGVHPLAFLTAWGQALQQQASDAFINAQTAQDSANEAQSHNIIQDANINKLLVGDGTGESDPFNGAAGPLEVQHPDLWDVTYTESGLGGIELSGDGKLTYNTNGGTPHRAYARFKVEMSSQVILVAIDVLEDMTGGHNSDPWLALTACGSEDNLDRIEARFDKNSTEIGYTLGGAYTRIGTAASWSQSVIGLWELRIATTISDRQFRLTKDGNTACEKTDDAEAYPLDDDHKYPGMIHRCGNRFIPFTAITTQQPGPDVGSFGASDRGLAT